MWPSASDLVIVPSMSEMTILVVWSQRNILLVRVLVPLSLDLTMNEILFVPSCRSRALSSDDVAFKTDFSS